MKWLKITVVFFLVTLVKCGPTRSEKDLEPEADAVPPAPIKLERIDRVDDMKFTVSLFDKPAGTTHLMVILKNDKSEFPYASEAGPSSTFTFNDNIKQLSEKKVDFEISAMNENSDVLGYATQKDFTFPSFPVVSHSQAFTIDDRAPVVTLLRVDGDMGTMGFKDGTKIIDSNYYSFQTTTAKYIPFIDVNSISVFDTELTLDSIKQTPEDIMTSAILSYQSTSSATIKFSFSDTPSPSVLDVILHATEPEQSTVCNKQIAGSLDCPIEGSFPGNGIEKMVIIKRPGDVETLDWSTCNANITDRELIATRLSNNIIEGRWKILDYESTTPPTPGNPVYRLRKTSTDGSTTPDDDIEVDCSHLEQNYCFGYFPTLEATKTYTLIVAHKTDNKIPGTYNEMQQVESIPQPPTKPSEPELGILSRHMTRHANQLTADVNICFQHLTPQEGGAFSHYEMLIINEKGQWLKHRILEEEEGEGEEVSEGRLCFAPFTINTNDFDLTEGTKVVISQRGVDGFTVLATGESKLL